MGLDSSQLPQKIMKIVKKDTVRKQHTVKKTAISPANYRLETHDKIKYDKEFTCCEI